MMTSSHNNTLHPDQNDQRLYNNINNNISSSNLNSNRPIDPTFSFNSPALKIATNNVCGISLITKQEQLLTLIDDLKLDILGVSETKLKTKQTHSLLKSSNEYQSWWNCDDTSPHSSGVGLIMHSSIAKYVQLVRGYKGRVIYANLYLRGRFKLRIIQVYVHANRADKIARLDCDKYIIQTIQQAHIQQFKVVIMGDFNADPDILNELIAEGKKFHWKYKLLAQLQQLNLIDTYRIFHNAEGSTWSDKYRSSRIDQIWIDPDLQLDVLYSTLDCPEVLPTDHHVLITYFVVDNILGQTPVAQAKRQKHERVSYHYKSTTVNE